MKTRSISLIVAAIVSLALVVTDASFAQAGNKTSSTNQSTSVKPDPCEVTKDSQTTKRTFRTGRGSGVTAQARELRNECTVKKAVARPWVEPCDSRADLQPGYSRDKLSYFVEAVTPEEQKIQCAAATKARCQWMYEGTYPLTGGAEAPDDWDPHWKLPLFYTRIINLECPGGQEPFDIDGIVLQRASRLLSPEEYAALQGGNMRQRAIEATATLNLPKPQPRVGLRYEGNVPYALVNGPTWFATDPKGFTTLSKRVQAGSTWVQVSAVPAGLSFTANGEQPSWCYGPGDDSSDPATVARLREQGSIPWVRKPPSGCSHTFAQTSPGDPDQQVSGSMQIRWEIYWVGSNDTSGQLEDMYTEAPVGPFAITEAQTLVTR